MGEHGEKIRKLKEKPLDTDERAELQEHRDRTGGWDGQDFLKKGVPRAREAA